MYRNLLVHIPTERSPRPAIDGSVSLAMTCGAHLDAIATGYESTNAVPFVAARPDRHRLRSSSFAFCNAAG